MPKVKNRPSSGANDNGGGDRSLHSRSSHLTSLIACGDVPIRIPPSSGERNAYGPPSPCTLLLVVYPCIHEVPGHRENDRADKQAGKAIRNNAANDSDERHQPRGRTAREDKGFQEIIDETDDRHAGRQGQSGPRRQCGPTPHDNWSHDEHRADLNDPEHQNGERQKAGAGNPSERHSDSADHRLQYGNADHTARHGAYGRAGEFHELLAVSLVNPEREPLCRHNQLRSRRKQKSRDDHGGKELQHPRAGAAHRVKQDFAERLQLREEAG